MNNTYYQSQRLIYHNTSLIQNYYTLHVVLKIKAEEEINSVRDIANDDIIGGGGGTRISDKVYFMICHACFWCASCIFPQTLGKMTIANTKDSISLTKCPSCAEGTIKSIPIAENEGYRFDYDAKRGLVMKFFR
jgi:hypothetical protein